jgi:hypothetical protein
MVYLPLAQILGKHGEGIQDSFADAILLRTAGDPAPAINELGSAIAGIDPNLPILQITPCTVGLRRGELFGLSGRISISLKRRRK